VEEILTVAADLDGDNVYTEPTPPLAPTTATTGNPPLDIPARGHDFDVLVRLLGPVEIDGDKDPIDRRRAVELVVYLATHPNGIDDERLKTALWPDDQAPQSSFNTIVTRARSRLGTDPDGAPHLPHLVATGGLYRLGPRVTTDVALFADPRPHSHMSYFRVGANAEDDSDGDHRRKVVRAISVRIGRGRFPCSARRPG